MLRRRSAAAAAATVAAATLCMLLALLLALPAQVNKALRAQTAFGPASTLQ
jgi:hypothetical protein